MQGSKSYNGGNSFWHPYYKSKSLIISGSTSNIISGKYPTGLTILVNSTDGSGGILSFTPNYTGTLYYSVNDVVEITGGVLPAKIRITAIGTTGSVTACVLIDSGSAYATSTTYNTAADWGMSLGTIGISQSRWYWEYNIISISTSKEKLGITTYLPTYSTTKFSLGYATQSIGLFHESWFSTSNVSGVFSTSSTTASLRAGDNIGMALDMTSLKLAVFKNGVTFSAPISVSSNTWYPSVAPSGIIKANFGHTSFSYSVPGYHSGIYTPIYSRLDRNKGVLPYTTFTNNNTKSSTSKSLNAGTLAIFSQLGKSEGKWYWEVRVTGGSVSGQFVIGVAYSTYASFPSYANYGFWAYIASITGIKMRGGDYASYGGTYGVGDVIGVALNMDAGEITMYRNGVDLGLMYSGLTAGLTGSLYPYLSNYLSTSGTNDGPSYVCNFGQSAFQYPIPTGYNPGLYI